LTRITPRIIALAIGLLAATVASAVAPTHPVFNPPVCKFLLGSMAIVALIAAHAEFKYSKVPISLDGAAPRDLDFVITFNDQKISLAKPDGSTEFAVWDDLESISLKPHDDSYFLWFGSYFLCMNMRSSRLLIPAYSMGLEAFLRRLFALPGIDRERVEVLLKEGTAIELESIKALVREGEGLECVLWTRDKGV
jgi:hypothetical protein